MPSSPSGTARRFGRESNAPRPAFRAGAEAAKVAFPSGDFRPAARRGASRVGSSTVSVGRHILRNYVPAPLLSEMAAGERRPGGALRRGLGERFGRVSDGGDQRNQRLPARRRVASGGRLGTQPGVCRRVLARRLLVPVALAGGNEPVADAVLRRPGQRHACSIGSTVS